MAIEALAVFAASAALGFLIGGYALSEQLIRKTVNVPLVATVAIVIVLALIVSPPALIDAYQRFEGIDLGKDGLAAGIITFVFAGFMGAAIALLFRGAIEATRALRQGR